MRPKMWSENLWENLWEHHPRLHGPVSCVDGVVEHTDGTVVSKEVDCAWHVKVRQYVLGRHLAQKIVLRYEPRRIDTRQRQHVEIVRREPSWALTVDWRLLAMIIGIAEESMQLFGDAPEVARRAVHGPTEGLLHVDRHVNLNCRGCRGLIVNERGFHRDGFRVQLFKVLARAGLERDVGERPLRTLGDDSEQ